MAKKKADVDQTDESAPMIASGAVKRIAVTIRGLIPGLLMSSKGGMVPEEERGKQSKINTREVQANNAAYWNADGKLALPWVCLYKCIVAGAKRYKFKGMEKM